MLYKKLLSLVLVLQLLTIQVSPAVVLAQEVITTDPVVTTDTTTDTETPPASPSTVENVEATDPQPTPTVIPTPVPTPTMSPTEYDQWKEDKRKLDDEQESREDEWEKNEEDKEWVASHGGNESYYTSGQWQKDKDEEAKKLAEQSQQQGPADNPVPSSDPFANQPQDAFSTTEPVPHSGCGANQTPQSTFSDDSSVADFSSDQVNSAESTNNDTSTVSNSNCTDIGNNSYSGGVSGDNTQHQNDGSVSMQTGQAGANGRIENNGNTNVVDSDNLGTGSASSNDSFTNGSQSENLNTGEDTENFAQGSESHSLVVQNDNNAYVDNQMDVEGRSGNNTVTENDGDVVLTTGDIELIANMLNILNLNITGDDFLHLIVNIFGNLNGTLDLDDIAKALGYDDDDAIEVIAHNDQTGDDSKNEASAKKEESTDVSNSNEAVVNNELNVSGVSGKNTVEGNDGGADVVTGRIQILANIMNFINTNFSGEKWKFIMVNVFGSLQGDIVLPSAKDYAGTGGSATAQNVNPGEGSTNTQNANSIDQTNVANANNIELENNVNVNGVSGNNQQNGNDDGDGEHTVQSGGTDVASQLLNYLNFNITGDSWVFLIVNVFGKWMGQIVGFPGQDPINAPDNGTFAALSVGSEGSTTNTEASNSNTGEDSVNTSNASNTSNTNVNNANSASIKNTINAEGFSGGNAVNNNDAGTSIKTGWVEIDANLLNIINMNVTGRSWMFVFLNVFGDFMGDIFFGRENVPVAAVGGVATEQNEISLQQNSTPNNNSNDQSSGNTTTGSFSESTPQLSGTLNQEGKKVLSAQTNNFSSNENNEGENAPYIALQNAEVGNNAEDTSNHSFLSRLWDMISSFIHRIYQGSIYFAKNIFNNLLAALLGLVNPILAKE